MAVFGAPTALEDHAERALHAALAMQERMQRPVRRRARMRVGVNTGDVVVGVRRRKGLVRHGRRRERRRPSPEGGRAGGGARRRANGRGSRPARSSSAVRTVAAKGKPGGVEGMPVARALRTMRPRGVGGFRASSWDATASSSSCVRRTAGRGDRPSRTSSRSSASPASGSRVSSASSWPRSRARSPHRSPAPVAVSPTATASPTGRSARSCASTSASGKARPADEVERGLEGREILALALGQDVAPDLHPLDARERLHARGGPIRRGARVRAARPCSWSRTSTGRSRICSTSSSASSSDVRAPVARARDGATRLLVERPAWGAAKRNSTVLWLGPLPADAATAHARRDASAALPERRSRGRVVERADGNPFFLEELVGELVDSGALVEAEGGWVLGEHEADAPDA